MARKLIFDPRFPDDLVAALDYYEPIAVELANRFRQQVNLRLDDIVERPESFTFDVAPIRCARLHRFPYLIFFIVKPDFISILAVLHGSSDPATWRDRLPR